MLKNLFASLILLSSLQADDLWLEFPGKPDLPGSGKHIVLISGDEEYRSEESCPMLAKILSHTHGFKTTTLFAINPEGGYIDPNYSSNIPGMHLIAEADLVIIGTRFRKLPEEQLAPLHKYLNEGKPIMGFRTSTHAFKLDGKPLGGDWSNFGPLVMGSGWGGHYGKHKVQGARTISTKAGVEHPITRGVDTIFAESDVYGIQTVTTENATILLDAIVTKTLKAGSPVVAGKYPQPAAWLREYTWTDGKSGTAFCSTFGSSCDFEDPDLRRLFVNAAYFLTDLEVPEKANVDYLNPFTATAYSFIRDKSHFKKLALTPADFREASPRTGPDMATLFQPKEKKKAPKPKKKAAAAAQ